MGCFGIANYTFKLGMAEQHRLSMVHCFAHFPSANSQGVCVMLEKDVASIAWAAVSDGKAESSTEKLERLLLH